MSFRLLRASIVWGALLALHVSLAVTQAFTLGFETMVQEGVAREGGALFRERCADCHGSDAKGKLGPDLTRLWTSDNSDQRVAQIIRFGIPGSVMPSSAAPDNEIRAIVAYLRGISTMKADAGATGNKANGERIAAAMCVSCHALNGRGGRLGPDLTRTVGSQPRAALIRAIRDPGASFAAGYEPVVLVLGDGKRIRGARKSEDAFSIQIMDTHERLQGYVKSGLREVSRDTQSLMPTFGPDKLSDQELDDVLAFLLAPSFPDEPLRGRP